MPRPSTPKLSPTLIARAALRLVDKKGEFTIPELAAALQVRPSSLYNHVGGKGEIVELMRGEAMSAVGLPSDPAAGDWTDVVRGIAVEYLNSYSRHPRLIPLLTSHTVRDRTTLRVYDALAEAFAAAGFGAAERLQAITILDSFVIGSALDAAAPAVVWEADAEAGDAFREALDAGLAVEDRARKTFLAGLELLLAGFRQASRSAGGGAGPVGGGPD